MGPIDQFGKGLGRKGTNSNLGNRSESEAFRAHPFLLGSEGVGVGGSSSELGADFPGSGEATEDM